MLKKILIIIILITIGITGYLYFLHSEPSIRTPENTSSLTEVPTLEFQEGIPILNIDTSGYSAGIQHGTLLKEQIQEVVKLLHSKVLESDTAKGKAVHTYLLYKAKQLDTHIPEIYRQEMQGIADSANVSYNDILLINTYDDLMYLAGCSSLAISAQRGEQNPYLIHARNLDYGIDLLAGKSIILNYTDQGFISVGFPGYIGVLSGTNFDGITLSTHTSVVQENKIGTPSGIVYRQIMEKAKNLNDVEQILIDAKRTIGNNLILSSVQENTTSLFEITADKIQRTDDDMYSVATNHFISKEMGDLNNATPNSLKRFEYLSTEGWQEKRFEEVFDATKLKEIMSFYNGDPKGWSSVANIGTVQSVIFIPELKTIYIAKGKQTPVTEDGYAEYKY